MLIAEFVTILVVIHYLALILMMLGVILTKTGLKLC